MVLAASVACAQCLAAMCQAQLIEVPTPSVLALGGSVHARSGPAEYTIANPAAITDSMQIVAWAAPGAISSSSIDEVGIAASVGPIADVDVGASVTAIHASALRQVDLGLTIAASPTDDVRFGATARLHSLAIDRYGSTIVPSFDLGARARIAPTAFLGLSILGLTTSARGSPADGRRIAIGLAVLTNDELEASVDVVASDRRPIVASLGITERVEDNVELFGSISSEPVALGAGFELELGLGWEAAVAAGARWSVSTGFRQTVGVRIGHPTRRIGAAGDRD